MSDDRTTNPRLLRRLCIDVLQRTPSAAERRAMADAPVAAVVTRLLASQEAMQVFVEEELWYFLLIDVFRPRTKNFEDLPERLRTGAATPHDAVAEVLLSTSFSLRNPGNDTFVTVVLEQCLGVRVQDRASAPLLAAGKQMYDGRKARLLGKDGASQSDFVRIVLADPLFTRHLLDRHHRRVLGVALPRDFAVDAVHADPKRFFATLRGWLSSPAYEATLATPRAKTDHQFVRSLYMDLLERTPDHEELRNMRNALTSMADPAPLRAVLAKVLLDSGKARLPAHEKGKEGAFVAACFERYLGRTPTQQESTRFVTAMTDGVATPTHVVRALVASPEAAYH
jgi:hypothetical protein